MNTITQQRLLKLSLITLICVGLAAVIVTFLQTLRATDNTLHNRPYFEVDLATIPEGEAREFEWHEKPFWIIHLSRTQIDSLHLNQEYLRNQTSLRKLKDGIERNINEPTESSPFLVVSMLSNVSPCGVRFEQQAPRESQFTWGGGFVDRCSNAFFDLAGRVYSISHSDAIDLATLPYQISHSRIMVFVDQPQ